MHSILIIDNNKKFYSFHNCSIYRSTVNLTIARYRTVKRWPYFYWFNKSGDIDVTMSSRRPDSLDEDIENMDMWVERVNKIFFF